MKRTGRMLLTVFFAVAALGIGTSAFAGVTFSNLGTAAPPATVGGYSVTPFDSASQAAITDGTVVTTIPGSPIAGDLTVSSSGDVTKQSVPAGGWATWSHSYTGPVFMTTTNTIVLTLPPAAGAFYFYAEPNSFSVMTITATTDTGATSGPIDVSGSSGATGFGFAADAGESIATVTVTTNDTSFAVGEFGIAGEKAAPLTPVPTMSDWGMLIFMAAAGGLSAYYLRKRLAES